MNGSIHPFKGRRYGAISVAGIFLLILVGFVMMVEQPGSAQANSANLPFAVTPSTTGTVNASPMPTGTVAGTVMPTPAGTTTAPLTHPIFIPIISS
jgi:hypothetical protein